MQDFVQSFVVPLLAKREWTQVCEIGASFGDSTDLLATLPNITITVIDPCLDCDLNAKYAGNPHVTVRKGISLEVLPQLHDPFDSILIDGDHNWFTVYHELKLISDRDLLWRGGIVFFHDVGWPWGRRDMYYQPEMVPPEHRHPWAQKGVIRGHGELSDTGGLFRDYQKATLEGGTRNGVLTAIEDFLAEHDAEYDFFRVRGNFGLGIMYRRESLADRRTFRSVANKGRAYNVVTWPKRFTKVYFPSLFYAAKSLLKGRGNPNKP